ncbi:hypothetical protein HPB51_028802 [Rhipicephalus microplus]|uniref:Uncharacterized protein n=1 Tax=Rhipicephalus microplus TaxID=6941 RepID=A0A9J6CWG5_RHIMP|nr:hypothetical protein HPB51_028802 [Rhipicephalus microplus]
MIPCEESTTLSSGDALRSMGDAELPQGENTDAMNPTNILAASDPMMTKHCGSGHCLSVCKVVLVVTVLSLCHFLSFDYVLALKCKHMLITPPVTPPPPTTRVLAISQLSDTVGEQVHFSKQLLSLRGGMLFCTVGILLRHLQHNSNLLGISHGIVEELHERDVRTDFLLALLCGLLFKNATLKVILMNATVTEKFSKYFHDAPIIRISGRTHPITQVFLEDLIAEKIITKASLEKSRDDPVKIVPDVLVYLMEISPAGTRLTCRLAVQASASQVSRMDFAPPLPSRLPRAAKDLCKSSTGLVLSIGSAMVIRWFDMGVRCA